MYFNLPKICMTACYYVLPQKIVLVLSSKDAFGIFVKTSVELFSSCWAWFKLRRLDLTHKKKLKAQIMKIKKLYNRTYMN